MTDIEMFLVYLALALVMIIVGLIGYMRHMQSAFEARIKYNDAACEALGEADAKLRDALQDRVDYLEQEISVMADAIPDLNAENLRLAEELETSQALADRYRAQLDARTETIRAIKSFVEQR